MSKLEIPLLILIIFLALVPRLYKISNPVADWHSFRQADTSSVTRHYVQHELNLLLPQYDDLSNIQSGQDNPQGYRMVEFPIYNLLHYITYKINLVTCSVLHVPCLNLETTGRLTTVSASLISIVLLYLIVKQLSGQVIAMITALIFSILPYNAYYSRVILPDPLMVTFSLAAVYLYIKHLTASKPLSAFYWSVSVVSAAGSLLIKPTAIFILLPIVLLPLIFTTSSNSSFKSKYLKPGFLLFIYFLLAFAPLFLWRLWIRQYPAGIPAYTWLLNSDGIRFRPAWFRWLFYERLTKLILGGFGLVLFIIGLISKPSANEAKKGIEAKYFYLLWLFSLLLYLAIIATGNVRHDYYQIPLIPVISIFVAQGFLSLWNNPNYIKLLSIPISVGCLLFTVVFSWYQIKDYYQIINPSIVETGQVADQLLPPDAKVIAPYNGDTAFLYQINRPGWPLVTHYPIQAMINRGATDYVSVTYDDFTQQLMHQYPILKQTPNYVIIKLNSTPPDN